jgi:glucokinase
VPINAPKGKPALQNQCVAGIDVGGTKIAVALAAPGGRVISRTRFRTRLEAGPHAVLEDAAAEIKRMLEAAGTKLTAVGVGCGGPLDRQRGLILSPPNLPGWDEFPVASLLEERLGAPVRLDNDANAAALGERAYGAGRGLDDLVYITISTGIGGGIIVGGNLVHGVGDGAGEVGHMTVLPEGPTCGCGARGCLEAICSGTSIARRAGERLRAGASSSLSPLGADAVTAQAVAEAAKGGDRLATEVWEETIYYLAVGVGNLFNLLAPEAVILGGGVSTAGEQLFGPLRREVRGRVKMLPAEKINVVQAALGGDSGIYGALILGGAL